MTGVLWYIFWCSFFYIFVDCYSPEILTYAKRDDDDRKLVFVSVVVENKNLVLKSKRVEPNVAYASFKNTYNKTGWSLLTLVSNGSYPDDVQAEAAGIAEGYITAELISMQFKNTMQHYCDKENKFCDKLKEFLVRNSKWIQQEIENNPDSSYWHQVSLIYMQLEGLRKGYALSRMKPVMSLLDFTLMQMPGDLGDLEVIFGKKSKKVDLSFGSCSGFVKLFSNMKDLAISHVTWNDYNSMLRIYKLYNLTFHIGGKNKLISGAVTSFSSYPAALHSIDDFYTLGSGLVSQETSIMSTNPDLWQYIQPTTLLTWVRVIIANRLASTGNQWCSLFERYNSGTYNNQWMILDYKLFEAGKPLKPDTFWVLEQLPGTVHMADMSVYLQQNGYWASYNLPYFPYIYNMSGTPESKAKFGSWFDYHENPRAQIFKRDHDNVVDMNTLIKLMRYNDYKHDPLSKCNCTPPYSATNAISARNDLNPVKGKYPIPFLGHTRLSAYDCKATNSSMAKVLSQFIVGGPTFDQQPPFQWSKTEWPRPLGHPDVFKFEPLLLDWRLEEEDDRAKV